MKCNKCGESPITSDDCALIRVNPVGELPAIWICNKCDPSALASKGEEVQDIVQMILDDNAREDAAKN